MNVGDAASPRDLADDGRWRPSAILAVTKYVLVSPALRKAMSCLLPTAYEDLQKRKHDSMP